MKCKSCGEDFPEINADFGVWKCKACGITQAIRAPAPAPVTARSVQLEPKRPPTGVPPQVQVINMGDWDALPKEVKARILLMDRWSNRMQLLEANVRSMMGLLGQSEVAAKDLEKFHGYLTEMLQAAHRRYDEVVGP